MKTSILSAVFGLAALTSFAQDKPQEKKDTTGFVFTDVRVVESTPVRDQNKSGTCWCFAGTAFFEDEIIRKGGKPVDLAEMYAVRKCYEDKADRYVRMYGTANFSQGGSLLDVPYVWTKYGIVPESVYPGLSYGEDNHIHSEMESAMKGYLRGIVGKPNKRLSTAWAKGLSGILDAYLGEVPETFVVDGKSYTPASYAKELGIDPEEYVALTSFSHHPFYQQFVVEVPDNWLYGQYYNLPLDEFKAVIDNAVENGYPLVWAADVSEPGFKWKKGFAVIPAEKNTTDMDGTELARWVKLTDAEKNSERFDITGPVDEIEVTQEIRQDMFDRQETTDDHGMEIVGYATDQNGKRYYKVRNSWTDKQVYGGYLYASEPYVLAKTMNIYVHRDALPKAIAKKLGIKQ